MISVIIPTYNGEKVIERAIKSVLNQQGNFDIEIIVVDDCSTDRTVEIAKRLGAKVYTTGPTNSGGPNKGRNIGLRKARGEYICMLDQDDEWLPDKLITQVEAMKEYDFCYSGFIKKNGNI